MRLLIVALAFACCLASPRLIAQSVILKCEGTDKLKSEPTSPSLKHSIAFDEKRKLLTLDGVSFDRELKFSPEFIKGKNFQAIADDARYGLEYSIEVNRVTAEFIYTWIPTSTDGHTMKADEIMQVGRGRPMFFISGPCQRAKAAF